VKTKRPIPPQQAARGWRQLAFPVVGIGLFATALLFFVYFTREHPPTTPPVLPNELPDGWRLDEIDQATPPNGVRGTTYVLAWKIVEDERPLRVEECIVMKQLQESDRGGGWVLADLYRHPTLKNEWRVATLTTSPDPTFKEPTEVRRWEIYEGRPNNKQVYAFLETVKWRLAADEGWKLVDGKCARQPGKRGSAKSR
jgi:hypothetical protein